MKRKGRRKAREMFMCELLCEEKQEREGERCDGGADGNVDGGDDGKYNGRADGRADGNVDGGADGGANNSVNVSVDESVNGKHNSRANNSVNVSVNGGADSNVNDAPDTSLNTNTNADINPETIITPSLDTDGYISMHIFNVRNQIQNLIKINPKASFANPAKYLIAKHSDAKDEEFVRIEVSAYAKKLFSRDVSIEKLTFELSNLKPFTAYSVNDEVIIFKDFVKFLDLVTQMFKRVTVMKPVLSNVYSDEIFLICGEKSNVSTPTIQALPRNYELYLDFLYCMYTYGLYVVLLIEDMEASTSFTKVEHLTITPNDEYRLMLLKYQRKLKELNISSEEQIITDD